MKILLVSDIHSDYFVAESIYHIEKPDFVLDCGDHTEIKNMFEFTPHFYIHGNHEPEVITYKKDDMSLPNKIYPGQVISLENGRSNIRITGLDGNYSKSRYGVTHKELSYLESIEPKSLDILLTHESPLLVSDTSSCFGIAKRVVSEIDRIKPKFVFSGHLNDYCELQTPGGVRNIVLTDIAKGYGILDSDTLEFNRVIRRFR